MRLLGQDYPISLWQLLQRSFQVPTAELGLDDFYRLFVEATSSLSAPEAKQLFSFVSQGSKFVISLRATQVLKDLE